MIMKEQSNAYKEINKLPILHVDLYPLIMNYFLYNTYEQSAAKFESYLQDQKNRQTLLTNDKPPHSASSSSTNGATSTSKMNGAPIKKKNALVHRQQHGPLRMEDSTVLYP
ncbi:MAG: hypothetical protein CUN55_20355 [Phototrophicales bacterium]|nr:MAG: hypothetical protein CUN55_20355 [Phototrophicales bacterium]